MCWSTCVSRLESPAHYAWLAIQGSCLLLLVLAYQFLLFTALVSLSVGLGAVCSSLSALCWNNRLDPDTEAIISLLVTFTLGQYSVLVQQDAWIGRWLVAKATKHSILLGKIPPVIYSCLFLLGYSQLLVQYNNIQPSQYDLLPVTLMESSEISDLRSQGHLSKITTFMFLLSISYMTYVTARFCDWIRYKAGLSLADRSRVRPSCRTYILYMFIQALLICLYGIPIFVCAAICKYLVISGPTAFLLTNFGAFIIGVLVAPIERSDPFPTVPLVGPTYKYENHLFARVKLIQFFLVPLVAIGYYGPESLFLSQDPKDSFILYTTFVGLATIQTTKVICNFNLLEVMRGIFIRREILLEGELEPADIENRTVELSADLHCTSQPDELHDPAHIDIPKRAEDTPANDELNANEDEPRVVIKRGPVSGGQDRDGCVTVEIEGLTYMCVKD